MKPAGEIGGWRESLAELVPDLALGLGAWAERLHALVGPLRAARPEPVGDPDGFDGLARRGSYERLTPFEWLLADEVPDEFLRRAASGEHAFWRLAHRGPAGSRRCVALVAGGAELLGAPRLVTLAALLAIARRAAEAQADFAWAFWGAKGPTLYEHLEADGVRHWLREGRTLAGPTQAEIAGFFEARVRPATADDAWLLGGVVPNGGAAGGASLNGAFGGASLNGALGGASLNGALGGGPKLAWSRVAVEQAADLEGRLARVRLERPGAAARSLELDLPLPALSARWLRSPFRAPTAPLQKAPSGSAADVRSAPAFSLDGRRLFVRLEGGAIAAYVVPNSSAAPASSPVVLRPQRGGRLLAAEAVGRTFWGVELIGTKLWLYRFGKRGGVGWEREFALPEGLPPFVVSPHASLVMRDGKAFEGPDRTYKPLAFLFVAPHFWSLEAEGDLLAPYPGEAIGLAHGQRGQGAMLSYVGEGRELALSTWAPIACDGELVAGLGQDVSLTPRDVLFGEWGSQCMLAAQALDGAWQLARWDARATPRVQVAASISPPPGARAIGLASWPTPGEPALVTLNRGRRDFQYVAAGAAGLIVELPEAVADAAFSAAARAIAYRTVSGLVVVHALGPGQDVLRLEPGALGPPSAGGPS